MQIAQISFWQRCHAESDGVFMLMWYSYPKTSDTTVMCVSCCSDGGWWAESTPLHLHHRTSPQSDHHMHLLYTSNRTIWSSTERALTAVLCTSDSALRLAPPTDRSSQSAHALQWLTWSSPALWFTAADQSMSRSGERLHDWLTRDRWVKVLGIKADDVQKTWCGNSMIKLNIEVDLLNTSQSWPTL